MISECDELENVDLEHTCVVVQTTYNVSEYEKIVKKIEEISKDVVIFNTICMATKQRQDEAKATASASDTFFVIGDAKSANSKRLYEITSKLCKNTYFIQSAGDIRNDMIRGENVGVTAGASTPDEVIEEVVNKLEKF